MTTFSEFSTGDTTRKTTFYEIYILFLAILMLVMLYILNSLADKIYMEEQNEEAASSQVIHSS